MIDYLGKSVKSIYHNLSPEVKPEIEMIKIGSLLMADDDAKIESTVIFLTLPGNQLNIYQLMVDNSIEFQCIYCNKFAFGLSDIDPINYLSLFRKERPILSIISNSADLMNSKSSNCLYFISLKNDNVLKTFEYTCPIYSTCFKGKHFGVGLLNGTIKIYMNNSLDLKYTINSGGIRINDIDTNQILMNPNISVKMPNQKISLSDDETVTPLKLNENNCFLSYFPETKSNTLKESLNPEENDKNFKSIDLNEGKSYDAKHGFYIPIFDLTENYLIYHFTINPVAHSEPKISKNTFSNSSTNNSSTFEMAFGALKNLKEWSLKSINEYSSLLKSANIKSNNEITKVKDTPLHISVMNLKVNNEKDLNDNLDKIIVPFFKDGLSIIQTLKNGKYIIVGNQNCQLYFIYELYPQTNLKYSNERQTYKIIYSLFRGNRPTQIHAIDIIKSFGVITSQRGTHHVYSLPNRDQQIIENLAGIHSLKSDGFSQGTDYLNQKIINGIEIATLNQTGQVFCSKIVTIDKVYLDNSIASKITSDSHKNRFSSVIRNESFLLAIYNQSIEIHLLYDNDKMILLKKIKLQLHESIEVIKSNFESNFRPEPIQVSKIQMNKRFLVESDTTDKNFSVIQTNPLFSFNVISLYQSHLSGKNVIQKRKISNERYWIIESPIVFSIITIQSENRKSLSLFKSTNILNEKNESSLYESLLCREQIYIPINKKLSTMDNNRKTLDLYSEMLPAKKIIINPRYEDMSNSIDIKTNFYSNKEIILETSIKNALETNIKHLISDKNSIKKPEDFVIQDNYYK